jgi:hypothetical protein
MGLQPKHGGCRGRHAKPVPKEETDKKEWCEVFIMTMHSCKEENVVYP